MVSAAPLSGPEEAIERALRPKMLGDYVGQAKVREQLEIFIGAARKTVFKQLNLEQTDFMVKKL